MAHYQVTVEGDVLHQLFSRDDGLARLVEQVLNQTLEAQVAESSKLNHTNVQRRGKGTVMVTARGP